MEGIVVMIVVMTDITVSPE